MQINQPFTTIIIVVFLLCGNSLSANAQVKKETYTLPPDYISKTDMEKAIKETVTNTVTNTLKDSDDDGVIDALDAEPNTPKNCPVDTHGRVRDTDGDGVNDCQDRELLTPSGFPVDPNGITNLAIRCIPDFSGLPKPEPEPKVLFFAKKSYYLSPEAQIELKNTVRAMTKNPSFCLAIEGYASGLDGEIGDEQMGISYNRAKAVADFLINHYNISPDRLKIKIKGQDDIIKNPTKCKKELLLNARVEIVVTNCTETSDEKPANAEKVGTSKRK